MSIINDFELQTSIHGDALRSLSGGLPAGLPDQFAELNPILSAYEKAHATIEADQNLTDLGKRTARQAAREKATAAVQAWQTARVTGIEAQIAATAAAHAKTAAKGITPPADFAVSYMTERLATMEPLEAEILYSNANAQERLTMETAAERLGRVARRRVPGGPLVWEHVLNPDRIAAVRAARQENADPQGAAALGDLHRIKNAYAAMASAAVGLLGRS